MIAAIELWLRRRDKKSKGPISLTLALMSWVYECIVCIRHWLYDKGMIKSTRTPIFIVSVGNITAGGSGKTPFVALLVSRLIEMPFKVAILSRGYRSDAEKAKGALFVEEESLWHRWGDEPYMLAKRFGREVAVIVGKHRVTSALFAHNFGCQLAVLDDGMQHRRLHRDIEIIVVEGRDPFGGGRFLPYGRLRESVLRMRYADLIVINGMMAPKDKKKLQTLTQAPVVQGEMIVKEITNMRGESVHLDKQLVAVFCAIGSPERFVETVSSLGTKIVFTSFLPDHKAFTREGLFSLAKEATAKGAHYLCCTEKDWVKLPSLPELETRLVVIRSEFVVKENNKDLEEIVKQIKSKVR
jgi:tetraacyldisaccharide 4'-kinase